MDPMDEPARLVCPWDSLGKDTGVGCHAPLQGVFSEIEPASLMSPALAGGFFTTSAPWKPVVMGVVDQLLLHFGGNISVYQRH